MPNMFRFVDSDVSLRALRQALEYVGLTEQETTTEKPDKPDPNDPACMRFACPWLKEPVELRWDFAWHPDGIESELAHVRVIYGGVLRGEVDVLELLRQHHAQPLADVIIERVVAACAEITGK